MAMRVSRVTCKGQVTILVDLRRWYHIEEGDTLVLEERGDHVALIHPENPGAQTADSPAEYARNGLMLAPHEMREVAAEGIAEENLETPRQIE